MTGQTTGLRLGDGYDWRSWASWRALLVTAAIIGFLWGVSGLAAESVVRDLLGMELGRASTSGPDMLALGVALAFNVTGIWIWDRILRPDEGDASERPAAAPGSKQRLLETSLALSWALLAFAVFCVIYFGPRLILTDLSTGGATHFVAVAGVVPALIFLTPKLRHFGARPLSAEPTKG